MITQRPNAPSRWAWIAPAAAIVVVVSCQSLSTDLPPQEWGFTTVAATKDGSGAYKTSPQAMFFQGQLQSVPNAGLVIDSCVDGLYTGSGNNISNVTWLEAGSPVTTTIDGVTDTLPRVATSTSTVYELPTGQEVSYRPGDSIVVDVPGAVGGFPAATIHAKTAEPFTIDSLIVPTGTDPIMLHWTAGTDVNSAMVLELRYDPSGGSTPTRELLCSFTDDGVDSIPFRQHAVWSGPSSSAREVVATRLRTAFLPVGSNGIFEVISTFQVPTPTIP